MVDSIFKKMQKIGSFDGVMQTVPTRKTHEQFTHEADFNSHSPALLQYHGGRTINGGHAKVFNVYLGTQNFDTTDFDNFTAAILRSYYISPNGLDVTPGTFLGSLSVVWPFSSTIVSDATIKTYVDIQVANGIFPPQDSNTNYALIFPVGAVVTMGGMSSCTDFCGYHDKTTHNNYFFVVGDVTCAGCRGEIPANQARMMIHAHEYAEWRSNPDGNAWYNNLSGLENADECAWQLIPWGPPANGWAVQPMAVNYKGCVQASYIP